MGKNRNIEAKRIKYLRQQKSRPRYLKPDYGRAKDTQHPGVSKIPKEAQALFAYRKRVQEVDSSKEVFITVVLDALFPNFSNPKPKQKEAEAMRLMVNKLEPVERKLLLLNGKYTKLAMLSNRDLN